MFTRSLPRMKPFTIPGVPEQLRKHYVVQPTSKGLQIRMRVKPDATVEEVTSFRDQCLYVSVAAPAREGRATRRVLQFMSGLLGLREGEASIVAGEKSRLKVIRIHSQLNPELRAKEQIHIFEKIVEALGE